MGYEHHYALIDLLSRLCAETNCKLFTIPGGQSFHFRYFDLLAFALFEILFDDCDAGHAGHGWSPEIWVAGTGFEPVVSGL